MILLSPPAGAEEDMRPAEELQGSEVHGVICARLYLCCFLLQSAFQNLRLLRCLFSVFLFLPSHQKTFQK